MILLELFNIKKYFGDRLIFDFPEFKIYSGDKIGIVGVNGAGKTTLLNVISGEMPPDEGVRKCYCDISYIRQFSDETTDAEVKIINEFLLNGKINRASLSGGEQTRVKIANAISKDAVLLLADEPTANLDYKGVELLLQKLSKLETLLIISHDRVLLDRLCNKIIEIKDGGVKEYCGNYSLYLEQSIAEIDRAKFEYQQYASEKSRLESAVQKMSTRAKAVKKTPKRMDNSEARLHKRESTEAEKRLHNSAKAVKSRIEKLEVKEKPKEPPKIKLDFSLTEPPENKIIISAKNLSFGYNECEIFNNVCFEVPNRAKMALIGENGSGKTTLFNLITERGDSIYTVPKARFGYFYQDFRDLNFDKTVLENVMQDTVQSQSVTRNILARLLFKGDDVHKKVNVLSGGEKIKLALAKLLTSNANVLLLDEPTNYLDISSISAMQTLLCEYEGTLLFVSHDKAFVNAIADKLLILKDKTIVSFDGNLNDYEKPKDTNCSPDKLLLEMKLTKILSEMSLSDADKETLENEYRRTLSDLKQIN